MLTENKKNVKIVLTGGGTGGSVTPLLAVAEELKNYKLRITPACRSGRNYEFLWLGTKNGIEKEMVEKSDIRFKTIISGKLRRYFSFKNLTDIIKIKLAFWQAFFILLKEKPSLVMSAGSFVSVPVVWATWLLHIPVLIHQQDARPGLANKLMAPFAKIITVTFKKSLEDYGDKAKWVGNPARSIIKDLKISKEEAIKKLGLNNEKPIVLIMGGGTGADAINKLVDQSIKELIKFCQVVHITGRGKKLNNVYEIKNYKIFEFLDTMALLKVYTASDIIISRCGMGALTELSLQGKPSILIPMPESHQVDNAEIFNKNNAAIVLDQNNLTKELFMKNIKSLLDDKELQNKLSNLIKNIIKSGACEEIVKIIDGILCKKYGKKRI